jgi:hypothetical protein
MEMLHTSILCRDKVGIGYNIVEGKRSQEINIFQIVDEVFGIPIDCFLSICILWMLI